MSSKIPVAISFAGVANFLGTLGVIGSLVFVGLELQANPKNSPRRNGTVEGRSRQRIAH